MEFKLKATASGGSEAFSTDNIRVSVVDCYEPFIEMTAPEAINMNILAK